MISHSVLCFSACGDMYPFYIRSIPLTVCTSRSPLTRLVFPLTLWLFPLTQLVFLLTLFKVEPHPVPSQNHRGHDIGRNHIPAILGSLSQHPNPLPVPACRPRGPARSAPSRIRRTRA